MYLRSTYFFILFLFIIISCKTGESTQQYADYFKNPTKTISKINIPVRIDLKTLESTINNQMDSVLYEDGDLDQAGKGNLTMKAIRSDNVTLKVNQQTLRYAAPVDLWIEKGIAFTSVEAEGEISLIFETNFSIDEFWNLETKTTLVSHEWIEKPILKLGFFNLPVKFFADELVDNSKSNIANLIDEQIKLNFGLRQFIEEAWTQLQKPVLISEEYNLWLKIQPDKVFMTPLMMSNQKIESTIIVEGQSEIFIDSLPAFSTDMVLPPFSNAQFATEGFEIKFLSEIPYKEAELVVKKEMIGETFRKGRKQLTIENINMYGQNGHLIINTKLSGAYNGNLYMKGKPFFNTKKNQLEIAELQYEMESKNFLQKAGAWLFPKGMEKRIEKIMRFPIETNMNDWKTLIQEKLNRYELNPNMYLTGKLNQFEVNYTRLTPEGIQMVIVSKGKINLVIENMSNSK